MNIYEYQASDGRKTALMIIGLVFIFTFADFMGAAYVFDDPSLTLYSLIFRILILIPYVWLSSKAYFFFRYTGWLMIAISMPTFIWSALTFHKAFATFYTLIIIAFFVLGMWELVYREKQKKYDYKKSAKLLLKDYPKPMTVKYQNFLSGYEKKIKTKQTKTTGIEEFIIRFIPPWSIFALPSIVGTISSVYLGFGGMVVGGMFASVIGCLLFIGFTLNRYRYDYIFEEAQKILDERKSIGV